MYKYKLSITQLIIAIVIKLIYRNSSHHTIVDAGEVK
jgi:hypothetical protein